MELSVNKGAVNFPEVYANELAYEDSQESVLFDLSIDGFYTQDEAYITGAVFGAGDFAIHHWDDDLDILHETVIYKGYGNLSHTNDSVQGKYVPQGSIEES